ncbi:hypothetical protein PsorP6_016329 [Peronosclerospora sorghi]|uniref:Uncharacterized protein n=1 Tax=Peronosclerospora sorghi TaxID=230839 RepID=A0ACC0VLG3_9STRA|nr:hypothetical protein PsorP6_016329 [Peronosclerospora sorghi]
MRFRAAGVTDADCCAVRNDCELFGPSMLARESSDAASWTDGSVAWSSSVSQSESWFADTETFSPHFDHQSPSLAHSRNPHHHVFHHGVDLDRLRLCLTPQIAVPRKRKTEPTRPNWIPNDIDALLPLVSLSETQGSTLF